eukprot:scaffold173287_cov18-Tisochrysis_lutea.AAC.1
MHPPDASVMTAVCCTSALHRLAHCCVQTCVPASTSLFGFQSILCASQNVLYDAPARHCPCCNGQQKHFA